MTGCLTRRAHPFWQIVLRRRLRNRDSLHTLRSVPHTYATVTDTCTIDCAALIGVVASSAFCMLPKWGFQAEGAGLSELDRTNPRAIHCTSSPPQSSRDRQGDSGLCHWWCGLRQGGVQVSLRIQRRGFRAGSPCTGLVRSVKHADRKAETSRRHCAWPEQGSHWPWSQIGLAVRQSNELAFKQVPVPGSHRPVSHCAF